MVIQSQFTAIDTVIGNPPVQAISEGKSDGVDFASLLTLLIHGDNPEAEGSSKTYEIATKPSDDIDTDHPSDDASLSLNAQLVIRTSDGREVLLPVAINVMTNGNDSSGYPETGVETGDKIVITMDTCSTDIRQLLENMINTQQTDYSSKDTHLPTEDEILTVGMFSAGEKVTILQQALSAKPETNNGLTATSTTDIPVSNGSIGSSSLLDVASVSLDEFMAAATSGVSLSDGEAGLTQGYAPFQGIEKTITDKSQIGQIENAGNGKSAVQDGAPNRDVSSENLGKNIQSIKDIPQTTLFLSTFDSVPQQKTNQPTILFRTVSGTTPLVMQTAETPMSENRFISLINTLVSSGAQVEIVLGGENGTQPVGSNTSSDILTAQNDAMVKGGTLETAGERTPIQVEVGTEAEKTSVSQSIYGSRIRFMMAQKAVASGQSGEIVSADSMNNVLENPEFRLTGRVIYSDALSSPLTETGENRTDNSSFEIIRHSGGPGTVSSSTSKSNTPLNNPSKPPDAVYNNQLVSDILKNVEPVNSIIIKTEPETERTIQEGQGSTRPERIALDHGPVNNATIYHMAEGTPELSDDIITDIVQSSSSGSTVRSAVAAKNNVSSAESALTEGVRIVSKLPASDRPAHSIPTGVIDTGNTILTQKNVAIPLHGIGQDSVPIFNETTAVKGLKIPSMTNGEVGKSGEDTSFLEVPKMNITSKFVSGETSQSYTSEQQAVLPDDVAAISGKPENSGLVESGSISVDTDGNGFRARHSIHNGQSGSATGSGNNAYQSVIQEVSPQTTDTVLSVRDTKIPNVESARTHTLIPGQEQSMVPAVEKHTRAGREGKENHVTDESSSEKTTPAVARTVPTPGSSENKLTQDFSGQFSNGRNMNFEISQVLEENKQGGTQNRTDTTDDTVAAFAQLDLTSDQPVNLRHHIYANSELRFGEFSTEMELEVMNSIVRQAQFMIGTGKSRADIQLEPPTLGRLKLEIITENSKITGKITVESHEVKQIVQNSISELREQLSQNGLKVESFDVQVGDNSGTDAWANREQAKQFDINRRRDVFNAQNEASVEKTAREPIRRVGISQSDYIDLWV